MVGESNIDATKRGRMIVIALVSTIIIVILKLLANREFTLVDVVLKGIGYSVIIYILLIWALKFQLTLYSLIFVLPLSVLYLFTQYVFLEYFFVSRTGRVSEFIFMGLVAALFFVGTYSSFLMANIYNVSTIKEIPLIQAARTTSYILTILGIFFITYSLMGSGVLLTIFILPIFYFVFAFLHIRNTEVEPEHVVRNSLFVTFISVFSAIPIVFLHNNYLVGALVPTATYYVLTGVLMNRYKNILSRLDIYIYILTIIVVYLVNFTILR